MSVPSENHETYTAAVEMSVRWLYFHAGGEVNRHTLFDYYAEHNGHGAGMETVSRRGAGGAMARRLHNLGLAREGQLSKAGLELALR